MTVYEQYKRSAIDFSQVGLERGDSKSEYVCTPKGAKVIGWTGVDGIHYCMIKGFREIFSVNPMAGEGEYVHPVARDFSDFLRLLLACGAEAAIEQAHGWDRDQFERFQRENPPAPDQREVLKAIAEEFSLLPMEDPFGYLKELQAGFDYSRIPCRAGAAVRKKEPEQPPEWKVYFERGFGETRGRGRPGEEIPVGKTFRWAGLLWHIPAVYVCPRGMAVDFLAESGEDAPDMEFEAALFVNGKPVRRRTGYGTAWNPADEIPGESCGDEDAKRVLEHYRQPLDRMWGIQRAFFPWPSRSRPKVKSLELELSLWPSSFPAGRFVTPGAREPIEFTNPVTGAAYTLSIQKCASVELPETVGIDEGWEFPRHCVRLHFTLNPELSASDFLLRDTASGDSPIRTEAPNASNVVAAAIGVIGGACGPTAIVVSQKEGEEADNCRAAFSSLHFQPVSQVEWEMVFREKTAEDIRVTLL